VQVMPGRNPPEARDVAAASQGRQLLVLSSSLPQGPGIPRAVRDLPIPVIVLKDVFIDNLGIGQPGFDVSFEASVDIVNPEHPLAAGRSGLVGIATERTRLTTGRPVPAGIVIATTPGNPGRAVIFALDRGATTPDGPTPARRVGWLADEPTIAVLNAIGWALFEAAVRWASSR
jgi:hypothetical protein